MLSNKIIILFLAAKNTAIIKEEHNIIMAISVSQGEKKIVQDNNINTNNEISNN